jgi:choline dehydrogenase
VADSLEADFVIVGAGSAGCVMAARLTEDPGTSVILLEAGGNDSNMWIHIPLGFGKTFADPKVNWCYETEPEPGAGGRKIFWPRGKVLGGSSSINGMVYIRGQNEDFDHWRQLGNAGWSSSDVLPYFKRAEHQTRGDDAFHSTPCARPSSRRAMRPATSGTTTSTAPTRTGWATIKPPSATASAVRPPSVTCIRR